MFFDSLQISENYWIKLHHLWINTGKLFKNIDDSNTKNTIFYFGSKFIFLMFGIFLIMKISTSKILIFKYLNENF